VISKRRQAARRWRYWLITRQPMAELNRAMERSFFFGEEGPEQLTSEQRVALAGSAAHKVFPNKVAS
jgi:hypothetical protein